MAALKAKTSITTATEKNRRVDLEMKIDSLTEGALSYSVLGSKMCSSKYRQLVCTREIKIINTVTNWC